MSTHIWTKCAEPTHEYCPDAIRRLNTEPGRASSARYMLAHAKICHAGTETPFLQVINNGDRPVSF